MGKVKKESKQEKSETQTEKRWNILNNKIYSFTRFFLTVRVTQCKARRWGVALMVEGQVKRQFIRIGVGDNC